MNKDNDLRRCFFSNLTFIAFPLIVVFMLLPCIFMSTHSVRVLKETFHPRTLFNLVEIQKEISVAFEN